MTQQEDKCVAGCKRFTGGEVRHHKHCPFYPDSLSKMYDKMKQKECSNRQKLLDDFARAAMQGELMNQSCENGYYTTTKEDLKQLAHRCYDIATAMMHERERRMKG